MAAVRGCAVRGGLGPGHGAEGGLVGTGAVLSAPKGAPRAAFCLLHSVVSAAGSNPWHC